MRRITKSLGVLAAAALAVSGISAGAASAATQQNIRTKAQWQAAMARVPQHGTGCYRAAYPALRWDAVKCVAAPKILLVPSLPGPSARHPRTETVGDGTDYSAVVTGKISKGIGTFTNVSSGITEKGQNGGSGGQVSNAFSLQLNSQFFAGSPACNGSSDPADCLAWQQFVYTYEGSRTSYIFMQYWLIDFNASCPSGWFTYSTGGSTDCYTNSNATTVTTVTASQLGSLSFSGTAAAGGNDTVSLSLSGHTTSVSGRDTVVDLAANWNTTEWGVYGDGGGSAANFGTNTTLEAQTALTATSSGAPSCVEEGFTGETNNLTLAATPALGSEPSPTMASKQTNGSSGTASCATAS